MLQTGDFDKKKFEQITKQEPVVGYGGFLKGVKAENQYGMSYRELAKKSIQGWSNILIIIIHKYKVANGIIYLKANPMIFSLMWICLRSAYFSSFRIEFIFFFSL